MKRCSIIWGLLLLTLFSFAQEELPEPEEPKGFNKEKLFIGGNFGLGFGSNSTQIVISPQLGYRFNRWLAAGAGPNLQYYSYRDRYFANTRESFGVVGFNVFGRVYPIEYVLLQIQPEMNYTWGKLKYYGPPETTTKMNGKLVPSVLAGAGAVIPSGIGGLIIMVQYDLLQQERSPYDTKPFWSIGYNVGL